MPIEYDGYKKAMEECAELIGIIAKKAAYPDTDDHPDGGSFAAFMEDEIGDVLAIVEYVTNRHTLNRERITQRRKQKLQRHYRAFPKNSECPCKMCKERRKLNGSYQTLIKET